MSRELTGERMRLIDAACDKFPEIETRLRSSSVASRIVVAAFLMGVSAKVRNDSTDGESLMLHGNVVARWNKTPVKNGRLDDLIVTDAGWPTPTTRSRLEMLPGVYRCNGSNKILTAGARAHQGHMVKTAADAEARWWNGGEWCCWRVRTVGATRMSGPSRVPLELAATAPERKRVR